MDQRACGRRLSGTSFANLNGFSLGMANIVLSYEGEKSCKGKIGRSQSYFCGSKNGFGEIHQCLFKVRKGNIFVNIKSFYLDCPVVVQSRPSRLFRLGLLLGERNGAKNGRTLNIVVKDAKSKNNRERIVHNGLAYMEYDAIHVKHWLRHIPFFLWLLCIQLVVVLGLHQP